MVFAGCDSETETPSGVTITLNPTSVELAVGETAKITANVTNSEEAVQWSSSDVSVVHVENGNLTALKVGSAIITAKVEDAEATATVTVIDNSVPIISLGRDSVEIVKGGEPFTFTATVTFGGETVESEIAWASDDETIVNFCNRCGTI